MTRWSVAIALTVWLVWPAAARAQQAVFLVRHAEKVDDSRDPPLSAAGEARARALADLLADARIGAIYATEFQRTQQTARPLAERLGQRVRTMAAADSAAQVARLRQAHASDVVLVVGHSNTLPALLSALGVGESIAIADDEYSNLFLVVPRAGAEPLLVRLRF